MAKLKKKEVKKEKGKAKKEKEEDSEEYSGGASMDDAFADSDDVEYGQSKPKKEKKKKKNEEELEAELDEVEKEIEEITKASNVGEPSEVKIKESKPIAKIKKGDKIKVDGKEYEVDQHYVLIDHGATKEMAIELFDKNDKDFQLRYFDDQVETTM